MSFTEIKAEELKDNPFDLIGKQWMLITAGNEEKCNTMTASWGGVGIMWGKPTATAYIRDSRYTKEFVDREDYFTLAFFGEEHREALNLCGRVSGRDEDKIKEAGLTPYTCYAYLCQHTICQDLLSQQNFLLPCAVHKPSCIQRSFLLLQTQLFHLHVYGRN